MYKVGVLETTRNLYIRPSTLLLGASDLMLFPLHQLVDFKSALMVSETSAPENPGASDSLEGEP